MGLIVRAVISLLISAVFCLLQWLGSLMSLCGAPTWGKFFWGAVGIFVLLLILYFINFGRNASHYDDPTFREMNQKSGISYEDYKRIKGGDSQPQQPSKPKRKKKLRH